MRAFTLGQLSNSLALCTAQGDFPASNKPSPPLLPHFCLVPYAFIQETLTGPCSGSGIVLDI